MTTVFADCGSLAGVFLSLKKKFFWCTEMLVQIFMDKYVCVCDRMGALSTVCSVGCCVSGTTTYSHSQHGLCSGYFTSLSTSFNYSRPYQCHSTYHHLFMHSFIYCKLNRMGSFFLMYTVYKCTMSIFLWCPTTICIRNGQ